LPVRDDAQPEPTTSHTLDDEHIFGHVRLNHSLVNICGVCEDAGDAIGVQQRYDHETGAISWRHTRRES
jgi:hypothetical protein